MEREIASQRCSRCYRSFTVLADESGDHDCPFCGFSARQPDEERCDCVECTCQADDDEEEDED